MRLSQDIARFTDQMVADCALDTTSIFFYDETSGAAHLNYLYHVGVSPEAQHCYSSKGIFVSDPFTRSMLVDEATRGSRFVRWEDKMLSDMAARAHDYRSFLSHHGVNVVGASTRKIARGLCLIIGVHCRDGVRSKSDVCTALLEHRIGVLSDMVTAQLLEEMIDHDQGHSTLHAALLEQVDREVPTPIGLSRREGEIARLICQGKQNKEIAYIVGLSEYTVENHLRRIYRKLDIHNRAALVAKMARQLH